MNIVGPFKNEIDDTVTIKSENSRKKDYKRIPIPRNLRQIL